jgi:hypothetical protein
MLILSLSILISTTTDSILICVLLSSLLVCLLLIWTSKLYYDRPVSRPLCLGVKYPLVLQMRFLFFFRVWQLRVCWCGAPSLTRRLVCLTMYPYPRKRLLTTCTPYPRSRLFITQRRAGFRESISMETCLHGNVFTTQRRVVFHGNVFWRLVP